MFSGFRCSLGFLFPQTANATNAAPIRNTLVDAVNDKSDAAVTSPTKIITKRSTSLAVLFPFSFMVSIKSPHLDFLLKLFGIFQPSSGESFIDRNGEGLWDGCAIDIRLGPFGQEEMLPVPGDWNGDESISIGIFDILTVIWHLGANGNPQWDGCIVDISIDPFCKPGFLPMVGGLKGSNETIIWTFHNGNVTKMNGKNIIKPEVWYFNRNRKQNLGWLRRENIGSETSGDLGDLRVIGDWSGSGIGEQDFFTQTIDAGT